MLKKHLIIYMTDPVWTTETVGALYCIGITVVIFLGYQLVTSIIETIRWIIYMIKKR